MAERLNHTSTNESHPKPVHTFEQNFHALVESKATKYAVRAVLGLTAVGIAAGSMFNLSGGNSDPDKYKPDPSLTSVTFEEGANIRYEPFVDNDMVPIKTLDSAMTFDTPDGAYVTEEFHNGTWIGTKADNIPNFDSAGDRDGVVWVNTQKSSASTNK